MFTLSSFYQSTEWKKFRKHIIFEELSKNGEIICEHCKKSIMYDYDIVAHHSSVYLTEQNVNDYSISLNPDNISLVHHVCHNRIHEKLTRPLKQVYIVFGSPSSGKSTYVDSIAEENDLIVDIDRIYSAISNNRSMKVYPIVMKMWNELIDITAVKSGQWKNAYIVVANCRSVERLQRQTGAELIFIDTPKEECLKRAESKIEKYGEPYKKAIEDFFNEYENTYKRILEPLL